MAPNFASGLKACGLAVALLLVEAHGAEQKYTPVGATRAQVIERLGEPRRKPIAAGNREILLYPTERLVLQNGRVIEVEPVAPEPARKTAPPPSPAPQPAAAAGTGESAPAPDAPAAHPPGQGPTPGSRAADTGQAAPAPAVAESVTPVAPPPPVFEIKSVRPGGRARPAPKTPPAPAATTPAAAAPSRLPGDEVAHAPALVAPPTPTTSAPGATPPPRPAERTSPSTPAASLATDPTEPDSPASPDSEPPKADSPTDRKAEAARKAKLRALQRDARDAELYEDEPPVFTGWSYVIAFLTIGVGVGYLWWRRRQHQIEMAATTVSRTPFAAPAASDSGARFTTEIIGRLEWKRFEELVAAYYSKTGVIAVRTKTGPKSAVHIKISWKGEPRPFAYVQCLSQQEGLIDAAPIQQLFTAMGAEDIRRGYVVSTGKFSVNARDLAEEKHLTLLPADIFLEKLNALPDAARTELMQEIMAGDPVTPSCPKCEGKMMRAPDDPALWRCPNHPDQEIPVRR